MKGKERKGRQKKQKKGNDEVGASKPCGKTKQQTGGKLPWDGGGVKENSAAEREVPSIRNEREGSERVGCENSNER